MGDEVFFLTTVLIIAVVSLSICNVVLSRRITKNKQDIYSLSKYIAEFTIKYNLLCLKVIEHSTSITLLAEDNISIGSAVNQQRNVIIKLSEQVDELNDNLDPGDSWKKGYRPDGSNVEDD